MAFITVFHVYLVCFVLYVNMTHTKQGDMMPVCLIVVSLCSSGTTKLYTGDMPACTFVYVWMFAITTWPTWKPFTTLWKC